MAKIKPTYILLVLSLCFILPSCKSQQSNQVSVTKPKTYNRWYQPKKDKKKKRTKTVYMKS